MKGNPILFIKLVGLITVFTGVIVAGLTGQYLPTQPMLAFGGMICGGFTMASGVLVLMTKRYSKK